MMDKRTFLKILGVKLAIMGATAAAVHLLARRNVAQIKQNPDPYTPEQLLQEPRGEDHVITAVDGAKIRVRVAGDGPVTIVLVHGYAESINMWSLMWHALLAQGYRVIAFDLREHGLSTAGSYGLSMPHMATDLLHVLEYFEVRNGIVVGHSLGGFLVLNFLLNHTAVVRRHVRHAILLSSLAGRGLENAPQNQFQLPLLESGLLFKLGQSQTYSWFLARTWVGDKPAASIVEAFRRQFLGHDHRPTLPALLALIEADLYPRLAQINIPCTVVYGTKDNVTLPFHSERMAERIPRTKLIKLAGAGHMLNWERPRELVEIITAVVQAHSLDEVLSDER